MGFWGVFVVVVVVCLGFVVFFLIYFEFEEDGKIKLLLSPKDYSVPCFGQGWLKKGCESD